LIFLSEALTAALEALSWAELHGMNEDAALRKTLKQLGVKDRGVAGEAGDLLYAVSMRRNALDYLINQALEPGDVEALDVGLRSFLRLYAYMVHYGGGSGTEVHGFAEHVRGVLGRRAFKAVEEAIDLIPHQRIPWGSLSRVEALAYGNFLPVWFVEYVCANFEEGIAVDLLSPVETPKYVRVNTLRGDESPIPGLEALGFRFDAVPGICDAYRVLGGLAGLTDTASYREGGFILQDKASMLVGEVAAPRPGDVVLDICAAPGVKTSHLAQLMGNRGRIISVDVDAGRLASWGRLMERMGVTIAEPVLGDASRSDGLPDVGADLVLLDPPCSGTGTFNGIPSTKWRVTRASIDEYAALQGRLMENAAAHVRPGGALVYSTCSVSVEENEGVVGGFLGGHPGFRLVEAGPRLGAPGLRGLVEAQRLVPKTHGCEGFFIARLLADAPGLR
jgi:16S rRNA (cytosine967-C5)-methyltransferase